MNPASDSQLKELLKAFSDLELLSSELLGGFSFGEIGKIIAVGNDIPAVVKDASVLWPQFVALDSAAQADLVSYVQANCKFPDNLAVEDVIQKVLSAAVMISGFVALLAPKAKA